jgi:hypothetical protein
MKIKCSVCEYEPYDQFNGEVLGGYWICDLCLTKLFKMIKAYKKNLKKGG